ncbi:MAG TPA: hypothetical protein DCK83_13635 [Gallionellaceae bacterium]|nr:hypothetical protein [Gallionellaceae bacterium]
MFDFLSFKKSVQAVQAHVGEVTANVAKKKQELEFLRTAPMSKPDLIEHFAGLIDKRAADYDVALQFAVNRVACRPLNAGVVDGVKIICAAPTNVAPSFESIENSMMALFGEEIKTAINKRINALPNDKKSGPRISERPAMIEKAERELAALEKELDALRTQAAQAGITL